ncbi:LPS export ABC transporter periplasmic protein LptC [Thiohalobacter sp. IOR34]|uniref:LPS export ABC transporter periplasmic protein LptC n=1 Tax=Thiohalobacter sp. IOR34 TaxID=3057176 RepID=UPI0025AEEDD3|nr:LPS export ABC transporter periplasmic protein LptC [Thiohalobacter sp. IOR34]WJW74857.1 LPS export ABC transporter periplasmic protein LptC [Thiohalobacter sp. IOR34]
MIPARNALQLGLLSAAALLSWWIYQQASRPPQQAAGDERHVPDAFMEDFTASTLDAEGRLQHRLWAERSVHYADDDSSELSRPRLELYRPDGPPWRVRSRQGWLSGGGREVRLDGQVVIRRAAPPGGRPVEARTERLLLWPERDYAESPVAVSYLTTGLRVEAVGMRAYLDQERLELLSRVRARYQPGKRTP